MGNFSDGKYKGKSIDDFEKSDFIALAKEHDEGLELPSAIAILITCHDCGVALVDGGDGLGSDTAECEECQCNTDTDDEEE